jgi:vacuolar protein sorting-associated protein 13A/C
MGIRYSSGLVLRSTRYITLADQIRHQVNRSISTGLLSISLSSQKRLELNITATFIELALTTAAILDKDSEKGFSHTRGANAPFLVKNRTGYPISIWSDTSDDSNEPASAKLDNGADIPWRFDDWRKMREVRFNCGAITARN